jgi:TusA-related sulfurtransferase
MIYRCHNPKNRAYKWYGARGIKVCEDWHNFENFKNWVLSTRPDELYSCERVDVNGDYCPENCTWIPLNEQANNRRTCIYITYNGKTQNLMQWCKELDLNYKLVHNRMYKCGYDFEKAIKTPKKTVKSNS